MSKYIRWAVTPLALAAVLSVGACRDDGDDLAGDTAALNRDLELANSDTSQPQLSDVPATSSSGGNVSRPSTSRPSTSRPSTTTPRPSTPSTTPSGNRVETAPSGSEGRVASIGAGTSIAMTSGARVCTNTHKPGDRFTATVTNAVQGSNGAVIPAGATAVVQVTSVERSENVNDPARLGLVVQSVRFGGKTYPIDASITNVATETARESTKGDDAKKVIGGAIAGAVIGQILGKDTKSTVIGAATGAAAGTAIAMGTGDYAGCIPAGGNITVRLNSAAQIQAE
ncbi:MAG TPA: glycine zipper 2TM domain-containing protein [Gemmatimonadaceae bacterium]|nr:glycine zipper 2TM domain-containing protein [Gemmatimonadaceae bacterium]